MCGTDERNVLRCLEVRIRHARMHAHITLYTGFLLRARCMHVHIMMVPVRMHDVHIPIRGGRRSQFDTH